MTTALLRTKIAESRAGLHGEYSSTSRVIDILLDLRALADDRQTLLAEIDHTIASVSGQTVTPNEWWVERLDSIELEVDRSGQGDRTALT